MYIYLGLDWVGGQMITNPIVRYANDTTLLAKAESEKAELLRRVESESNSMGLEIKYKNQDHE
jgi:hypothetical protein